MHIFTDRQVHRGAAARKVHHFNVTGPIRLALAALFIISVTVYAGLRGGTPNVALLAAAGFGAYMAMNIGANDVANNVGSAVGARVLSLGGALVIAAIFEAAGALIAGHEVIGTIRGGIVDPALAPSSNDLIRLMLAALLAAALWLNIASIVGAPISTTHSIVGGVLGAGVAASGFAAVQWGGMGAIAMSWVISPVLGGLIAAGFLYAIKRTITYQKDMVRAACSYLPLLVAVMAWAFSCFLLLEGLNRLWPINFTRAALISLVVAAFVHYGASRVMTHSAVALANSKQSINRLFALPLVCSVALLSFAHGSNDVANALAPLAAVLDLLSGGAEMASDARIPQWVMVVGAAGIALGLALYGSRVIRTVGTGITALDPMRAYCIAMAATLTVILASQLGLPVSTTHVTVGAVFGVGLLREHLKRRYECILDDIRVHHSPEDEAGFDAFMARFTAATIRERGQMLTRLKQDASNRPGVSSLTHQDAKRLRKEPQHELVKRSLMYRIVAAWLITVPASAALAAVLFFMLRGILMP